MKIAYLDCFSGISGDMCLGAVVDAGVSLSRIKAGLKKIPLDNYTIKAGRVTRAGISATKVDVIVKARGGIQDAGYRKWKDIRELILKTALDEDIKERGLGIFEKLFKAEAKVHGMPYDKVHLHELGAADCIIDIFGTLLGLRLLGIEKIYSSPVNLGSGFIRAEHGTMPVPAPASLELLKGMPVYSSDTNLELATPTGSAILKEVVADFGCIPHMVVRKIGIGAGSKDLNDRPNVLRLLIGEPLAPGPQPPENNVTLIETNIDDMNPQVYEYLVEELLRQGALDVYLTQVVMKKGRPGTKLTALCDKGKRDRIIDVILRETTSIGVRYHETSRVTMDRQINEVNTKYGRVKIKLSGFKGSVLRVTPEYEDCKKIARKTGAPLLEILEKAKKGLPSAHNRRIKPASLQQ